MGDWGVFQRDVSGYFTVQASTRRGNEDESIMVTFDL
jgi:hypothetical protein